MQTLALDYTAGHITPPFEPTPDDALIANDVTAKRVDGSSAQRTLESGPLSTQAPPNGVGRYDRSGDFNVASDGQLGDIASWWLHHGTWDEDRYPAIRTDLRGLSVRDATLVAGAAALDAAGLVTVDNLPAWLPPDRVEQLTLGYDETISAEQWIIDWHTTPAGPYRVGVWADATLTPASDAPQRYDTAGSELAADFVAGTGTALSVSTTSGPLWTTDSANLPFDLFAGGVRLRVTAITGTTSPQTMTVEQSPVNGIARTIPAGTPVSLWHPAVYAL